MRRSSRSLPLLSSPQLRPWRSTPIPRRFPDYHGDFLTPPPARSQVPALRRPPGHEGQPGALGGDLGFSQFIFGYLALLTELSRVCEGAPPNVVLHNFDTNLLTILGIASPLNL